MLIKRDLCVLEGVPDSLLCLDDEYIEAVEGCSYVLAILKRVVKFAC